MSPLTIIYLLLAAVLFYTAFCRLVWVDRGTLTPVRIAFWGVACACSAVIFAVLFWRHVPAWPDVLLVAAFVGMQVTTSRLWRTGVPGPFRREPK